MGFFDSWKVNVQTFVKHPVIFPGNVVEGYVQITASSNIDFVAVRLKATGKERVTIKRQETEGFGEDQRQVTKTYKSSSVFYKQLVTLAGAMKCSGQRQSLTMPGGTYTYPFAFQLPAGLPASLAQRASDDFAEIAYYIKAYVDIPMGRDANHKTYLTVLKPMPQSQWVHRAPVSVDRSWDVTCCCCISKGRVSGRLFMDRTMIAMDRDNLTVCAQLDNSQGEEEIQGVEISLINLLEYKAHQGTFFGFGGNPITERNRVRVGHEFIKTTIPAKGQGLIQGTIPLPRNIAPTMTTYLIKSEFMIELELNIPMASDPSHTFPVIVAQSVDDQNFSPPVQFTECNYTMMGKDNIPEFYYQPPPTPVYQCAPIPVPPPPSNYPMMQVNFSELAMPLPPPNGGWQPPSMYEHQTHNAQVQWQTGYTQSYQQVPPPPPQGGMPPPQGGMPPPQQGGMPPPQQQAAPSGNEQQPLLEPAV